MASLRVGSLFGIPIKLGASLLLILPLLTYLIGTQIGVTADLLNLLSGTAIDADALTNGLLPWVLGVSAAVGLFVSVLLHELGHSLVARRYGLEIEAITLWFLGGLAQFTEFPEKWRQEFVIAIMGPVVSVAVGVLAYVVFILLPANLPAARFVFGYLAVLNVALAAFNMLPGFPMDGGRVLRALLSRNRSRVEATRIAAAVGKGFAVLLGIGGIVLFNFFWIAIAFFIYLAATSETQQIIMEAAFEGLTVEEIMTPASELDTVTADTPLDELLDRMVRERHTGYPVLEHAELVGLVTLEDVEKRPPAQRGESTVGDVMTTDLVTVTPTVDATEALQQIQRQDIGRILVVDVDGSLAGLVSRTDLMTVLEIAQTSRSSADRPGVKSAEPRRP